MPHAVEIYMQWIGRNSLFCLCFIYHKEHDVTQLKSTVHLSYMTPTCLIDFINSSLVPIALGNMEPKVSLSLCQSSTCTVWTYTNAVLVY